MIDGPDFIIAGAMRAGTTALAQALDRHPEVALSRPKEPSFFTVAHGGLEFRGPGDQWFARQNAADWDAYLRTFDGTHSGVHGEGSAMYLAVPGTAADIAAALPAVKVVLVLRDPWARAMSAHGYLRTRGREPLESLEQALEAEPERRAAGFGPMWWYHGASDYADGLEAFRAHLGPDRIHVIISERLTADPDAEMDALQDFLGLERSPEPAALLGSERVNSGGAPRNWALTRALYPPDRLRAVAKRLLPSKSGEWVRAARRQSLRPLPPEQPPVSLAVRQRFAAAAQRTCETLDLDLSGVWPSLEGAST